jgi:hypothetical protein
MYTQRMIPLSCSCRRGAMPKLTWFSVGTYDEASGVAIDKPKEDPVRRKSATVHMTACVCMSVSCTGKDNCVPDCVPFSESESVCGRRLMQLSASFPANQTQLVASFYVLSVRKEPLASLLNRYSIGVVPGLCSADLLLI